MVGLCECEGNVKHLQSVGKSECNGGAKIAAPHLIIPFRPLLVVVDVVEENQVWRK